MSTLLAQFFAPSGSKPKKKKKDPKDNTDGAELLAAKLDYELEDISRAGQRGYQLQLSAEDYSKAGQWLESGTLMLHPNYLSGVRNGQGSPPASSNNEEDAKEYKTQLLDFAYLSCKQLLGHHAAGNLADLCSDGIVLCTLLNTAFPGCLDVRAVNSADETACAELTAEDARENLQLAWGTAAASACNLAGVAQEAFLALQEDALAAFMLEVTQQSLFTDACVHQMLTVLNPSSSSTHDPAASIDQLIQRLQATPVLSPAICFPHRDQAEHRELRGIQRSAPGSLRQVQLQSDADLVGGGCVPELQAAAKAGSFCRPTEDMDAATQNAPVVGHSALGLEAWSQLLQLLGPPGACLVSLPVAGQEDAAPCLMQAGAGVVTGAVIVPDPAATTASASGQIGSFQALVVMLKALGFRWGISHRLLCMEQQDAAVQRILVAEVLHARGHAQAVAAAAADSIHCADVSAGLACGKQLVGYVPSAGISNEGCDLSQAALGIHMAPAHVQHEASRAGSQVQTHPPSTLGAVADAVRCTLVSVPGLSEGASSGATSISNAKSTMCGPHSGTAHLGQVPASFVHQPANRHSAQQQNQDQHADHGNDQQQVSSSHQQQQQQQQGQQQQQRQEQKQQPCVAPCSVLYPSHGDGDEEEDAALSGEERVLRLWLNSLSPGIRIGSLWGRELGTGWPLLLALDVLCPGCVPWSHAFEPPFELKVGHGTVAKLKSVQNCNLVIDTASRALGLHLVNIGGLDVYQGLRRPVLSLLFQLMRFHISNTLLDMGTGGSTLTAGGLRSASISNSSGSGGGGKDGGDGASCSSRQTVKDRFQVEEFVLRWANQRLAAAHVPLPTPLSLAASPITRNTPASIGTKSHHNSKTSSHDGGAGDSSVSTSEKAAGAATSAATAAAVSVSTTPVQPIAGSVAARAALFGGGRVTAHAPTQGGQTGPAVALSQPKSFRTNAAATDTLGQAAGTGSQHIPSSAVLPLQSQPSSDDTLTSTAACTLSAAGSTTQQQQNQEGGTMESTPAHLHVASLTDPVLRDGQLLLELLSVIAPRAVSRHYVLRGEKEEERISNARYFVAAARKVGCALFCVHEDIITAHPQTMLLLLAALHALERRLKAAGEQAAASGTGDSVPAAAV